VSDAAAVDASPTIEPVPPRVGAGQLALVMSGGGARAAYQVGFLRALARAAPDLEIPVLTGVSAGAINAIYLAAHKASLAERAEALVNLWTNLTAEHVFRVDGASLARNMMRLGFKLVSGGAMTAPRAHAFVDTTPLWSLLERELDAREGKFPGIAANLKSGALRAVAITASSYSTGQSITWVQGEHIELWERAHRKSIRTELEISHVMASTALPILFPAVQVEGQWYGDGGIRLTAPFSTAIHLGADKVIAISTRYGRSRAEADRPAIEGYPPPAQVIGVLFNAIFLDLFDADALSIERVNRMIECVPAAERRGLRPVKLLLLRPSRDLGQLANAYEARLPRAFRFMTRGLGTKQTRANDMLSLVMFQPDYLQRLIELGEADGEARRAEIQSFLN
jgi:NTE family protein